MGWGWARSGLQALQGGRRNSSSSELGGTGGAPRSLLVPPARPRPPRRARQPGARASLGSARAGAPARAAPAAPAAGLPGNTNQTPAFRNWQRTAAAAGGLGLWAVSGRRCAAPPLTGRLRAATAWPCHFCSQSQSRLPPLGTAHARHLAMRLLSLAIFRSREYIVPELSSNHQTH